MNSKETATHSGEGQIPDILTCLLKLLQALNSVSLSDLLHSKNLKQQKKHTLDFDLLHCFVCVVVDGDSDWNRLTMVVHLEGMCYSEIQPGDFFQALTPLVPPDYTSQRPDTGNDPSQRFMTPPSMTSNVLGRASTTPSK